MDPESKGPLSQHEHPPKHRHKPHTTIHNHPSKRQYLPASLFDGVPSPAPPWPSSPWIGMMGMAVSDEWGGAGMDYLAYAIAMVPSPALYPAQPSHMQALPTYVPNQSHLVPHGVSAGRNSVCIGLPTNVAWVGPFWRVQGPGKGGWGFVLLWSLLWFPKLEHLVQNRAKRKV